MVDGRHHGPVGARGAPLQVRLRHGHQFLQSPRRGRAALRRWHLFGADVLPADRRPRGRGHQERRHHPPRRQDGLPRPRSPGCRRVHQLESRRGEEGRRPDRRRLSERFQRRGVRYRLRTELQQLRPHHQRFLARQERRRLGTDPAHRPAKVNKTVRARDFWRRSPKPPGSAPIPGIQYDTTINEWHTCPEAAASMPAIRAASTCSSTTPPAIWPPST